ncbi:MAG: hypothetical protein IIY16_05060, partial [Oscillospiraceae bacterium]|nr:hypothetical protein [Oscillospiraceae bacterium]
VSPLLSFTLRYDYVLLAMVRMLLTDERGEMMSARCLANPLRRKQMLAPCEALSDTAHAAALLCFFGVQDNIADERGLRRLAYRLAAPPAAAMRRKALSRDPVLHKLDDAMTAQLSALASAEQADECSPDAAAEPFSVLLGEVFAYGMTGTNERIARGAGEALGRYIYLIDAVDDAPKDARDGSYNPFVLSAKEEGISADVYLSRYRERIENALLLCARAAYNALSLADGRETHPAWPCVENILTLGLPHMAKTVLDAPGQKRSHADPSRTEDMHTAHTE